MLILIHSLTNEQNLALLLFPFMFATVPIVKGETDNLVPNALYIHEFVQHKTGVYYPIADSLTEYNQTSSYLMIAFPPILYTVLGEKSTAAEEYFLPFLVLLS